MINKLWRFIISIELCLGLLALVCIAMAAGSFVLKGEYAAAINGMPLLAWLLEVPAGISWWLWLTVVLLALLVLNTVLCSCETLWSRWGRGGWAALLAPQMIHAGFLLVVLAHLVSSYSGYMQPLDMGEGMVARLPDGRQFGVAAIGAIMSPMGMPVGYTAELVTDLRNPDRRVTISPNNPWFSGGYGVYIKHAEASPSRHALLEIHREPGAGMALAGALVFTIGNVMLVWLRSRARENSLEEVRNEIVS